MPGQFTNKNEFSRVTSWDLQKSAIQANRLFQYLNETAKNKHSHLDLCCFIQQ
jgi:hypothetical protein